MRIGVIGAGGPGGTSGESCVRAGLDDRRAYEADTELDRRRARKRR